MDPVSQFVVAVWGRKQQFVAALLVALMIIASVSTTGTEPKKPWLIIVIKEAV